MAKILITTFGSYGDLYPYLAIGRELLRRGHAVVLGTSAAYRSKAEENGLQFAPVRPDVNLGDRDFMNYVFDAKRGSERILRGMAQLIGEMYEDTLAVAEDADVIVTHPLTFAATLIAKQRKMPWASTVLAPISFISSYDPPVLAPAPWLRHLSFMPRVFWRGLFGIGSAQALGWSAPVIEFGRKLGLTPEQIGNPVFSGAHSPQSALALFPRVLAEQQPDWPAATEMVGFPFFEQSRVLAPELEGFLTAGDPPVVFTLGSSAVGAAGNFYRDSFAAVRRLGVRTLFLTGSHPQGLPEKLPDGMFEWGYAPHAEVFRRAAVIVHQGGIGTTSEALRAGKPMLVVPFAHDQHDNAERCRRIGVAEWVGRESYGEKSAYRALRALLDDSQRQDNCAKVAVQVESENGARNAAAAIEKLTTH